MIGIVFGCYIPLHDGHMTLINRALDECDKVIIGVCGYADDRGKDFIPFKDRVKLMKKKFKNNPKVIISVVDDKKIGLTGKFDLDAWKIWSTEFFNQAHIDPNCGEVFVWYMGERDYANKLKQIFTKRHSFVVVKRNNISGTKIRNKIYKYGQFVDDLFIDYLSKKNPFIIEHNICDGIELLDDIETKLREIYKFKDWGVSWNDFLDIAKKEINRYIDSLKNR